MNHLELMNYIEELNSGSLNEERLYRGVEYFCDSYSKCEGYKHALILSLKNDYEDSFTSNDLKPSLKQLQDIIDGAI